MTTPQFYAFDAVTCAVGSRPCRGGFTDSGEGILIAKTKNVTSTVEGIDGAVAVSTMPGSVYDVTIKLLQTTKANEIFDDMLQATKDGKVAFKSLYVNDQNGGSIASGVCWIEKPADVGFGQAAGTREWKLKAALTKYVVRGNNDIVVT